MSRYDSIVEESIASQDKFELHNLLVLLAQIVPETILEIGVHRGGMLQSLRRAFPSASLIGVDLDFQHLRFRDFVQIEGDSTEPAIIKKVTEAVDEDPVDFLFIDGGHEYWTVLDDFENYRGLVRPGGIIAFHDIKRTDGVAPGVESYKLWAEILSGGFGAQKKTMEIWGGVVRPGELSVSDAPGIGVLFV